MDAAEKDHDEVEPRVAGELDELERTRIEIAIASEAIVMMQKVTVSFVFIIVVIVGISIYYYLYYQGIRCEPCLPDCPCPPCPSENRHYVLPAFIGVEATAIALFFVSRRLLIRSSISR